MINVASTGAASVDTMPSDHGRLLLYAPVPLYRAGGTLLLEAQACNGIRRWAENFGSLTIVMPL